MSFNSPSDTICGNINTTTISLTETGEPERLQEYRNTVAQIITSISTAMGVEQFSQEFKKHSIARKPENINVLHEMLNQTLYNKVNDIIEKQIKGDKLEEKFSELNDIIASNTSMTPAWRPSRDMQENMRSQIMREKIRLRDELQSMVSKKEDVVVKLKHDISTSRNQTKDIENRLMNLNSKLNDMLNGINHFKKRLE